MLTDEELTSLISRTYAAEDLGLSLDAVARRSDQRRRHARIAIVTSVATVAAVVAGLSVLVAGTSRTPVVTPAQNLATSCISQYHDLIAGRSDRDQLPPIPPAPMIDMHRGAAEFRLYATAGTPTLKRIVLDCSRTAAGQVSANVTVATALATPVLGDANSIDYYRDHLADGSGALVGSLQGASTTVTVTTANGTAVPVSSARGFFVAWSPTGDLDNARVTVSTPDVRPVTLDAPTMVSGTFDPQSFQDFCARTLTQLPTGSTEPAFSGSLDPVIKIGHDSDIMWIYHGNLYAMCEFDSTATSHGVTLYTGHEPVPAYGIVLFVGDKAGFIAGHVPADTTGVTIVTAAGMRVPAEVTDGIFATWMPGPFSLSHAGTIIATSPTETYTIIGKTMTTTPNH